MALTLAEINKRLDDSYELPNNVLKAVPEPMVTIRTSAYQQTKYIKQCLDGILMQKTTFPIEFIIGEDFSTDGTREICFEYAEKYPDIIRLITADYNVGMKANGKRCMQASRGKYMAVCEGDDYWTDPYKLQKQVDILEKNDKYSLCVHDVEMVWDDVDEVYPFSVRWEKDEFNFIDVLHDHFIPTLSILVRSEFVKNPPEWYMKTMSGDIAMALILLAHGDGYYIHEKMGVKRKNRGGITFNQERKKKISRNYYEMYKNINQYTEKRYNYLIKKKIAMFEWQFAREAISNKKPFEAIKYASLAMITDPMYKLQRILNKNGK